MLRSGILSASVTATVILSKVVASSAQRLFKKDSIELRGTARAMTCAAGTCDVVEASQMEGEYERTKANHGQSLDLWQLASSVHNGSGK